MLSCAGVVPLTGNPILMRPLKPTGDVALISSCGSVDITDHADSSITNVNVPSASTRLLMVNDTDVGVGV